MAKPISLSACNTGFLKFSGQINGSDLAIDLADLADNASPAEGAYGGVPFPAYPIAKKQTLQCLAINVTRGSSLDLGSESLSFQLLRNGTPIGLPVVFTGPLSAGNNVQSVTFEEDEECDACDLITLRATQSAPSLGEFYVSATAG